MYGTLRRYAASSARSDTIGFIGLGNMGGRMATNLLRKVPSRQLVVHDAFPKALQDWHRSNQHDHVTSASSPLDVVQRAATVITVLPSSKEVLQVYKTSEKSLFEGLDNLKKAEREETLFVDCTTLEQQVARDVATEARLRGAQMLDAPISGGIAGAEAGTLSFMVGGDEASFNRASVLFDAMGQRKVFCGQSGNGLAAKIANNLLLGISMLGTAEAMLLGTKLGLPPRVLADIINASTGRCWASAVQNPCPGALETPAPSDKNYQGGFMSKLMSKDLGIAMVAAEQQGLELPGGRLTDSIYKQLKEAEQYSNKDFSIVIQWLEQLSKGAVKTK